MEHPSIEDLLAPPRIQLLRFFLVGTGAAGLQMLLLWLLVAAVGLHYLLAAVVAIEITIVAAYVANNAWTFRRNRHVTSGEYLRGLGRTNLVRGSAIPIQTGLLWVGVEWVGAGYLLANMVAIGVTGVYRYVLDARWTWRNRE